MTETERPGVFPACYAGERPMPGTEDFIPVADCGDGGYDWAEIRFYYSPRARRYFWFADAGGSCSYWGFHLDSISDMESGDRAAALRALDRWGSEQRFHSSERATTAAEIRDYAEPVA